MTEEIQDSALTGGSVGLPNQPTSSGQSGQQSSEFDAGALKSTLEAIAKRLDEVDARSKSLQGDKDRGVNKTRKEVDELKRQIAEIEMLKKTGLNDDSAIEEFTFREDVRSLKDQLSKLNPVSPQAAGNGASGAVEQAQVISEYQLNGNDPEIIAAYSLQGDAFRAKVADIAYRRATKQPPSAAASSAFVGEASTPTSAGHLESNYKKEMLDARGKGNATGNAIKNKYRSQGLDVDNISFSV